VNDNEKLVNLAVNAGVAYLGYRAFNHPIGALVGILALRLSKSPNLASGIAGVATLTSIGCLNVQFTGGDVSVTEKTSPEAWSYIINGVRPPPGV